MQAAFQSIPTIALIWLENAAKDDNVMPQLKKVRPDREECEHVITLLLGVFTLEVIRDLPPSLIKFLIAGYRMGVRPHEAVKSLIIAPFLPEADQVVQGVLQFTEVPNNVKYLPVKRYDRDA